MNTLKVDAAFFHKHVLDESSKLYSKKKTIVTKYSLYSRPWIIQNLDYPNPETDDNLGSKVQKKNSIM